MGKEILLIYSCFILLIFFSLNRNFVDYTRHHEVHDHEITSLSRRQTSHQGQVPLHTLRAYIDYAVCEAHTKVGVIGIKVWICNGEIFGKRDLSPNIGVKSSKPKGGGFKKRRK